MRHVREILRQKWVLGRSHREVAQSLAVSTGAVSKTVGRAGEAGLDWSQVEALTEPELAAQLYGVQPTAKRPLPVFAEIHTERQRVGVTLELLHIEYLEQHPDGYRYTQFCEYYRRWCRKFRLSMRQVYRAGEKLFVDYSGKKPAIVDRTTGEETEVELFVAALGASSYTYAECTHTQRSADFIASHTRAVEFLGGVTELVIPDQLKTGVKNPCRYEPSLQRSYQEWAKHYGTTVLPARPRKPRDKAKVEVGVQVVQRWVLARLRNETFFTLAALNARIKELLADLNDRPMRAYGKSRRQRFLELDQPALKPLPPIPFEHGDWKRARVNIDYHVELDKHYYSVPYPLVHEEVEIRYTAATVETFHQGCRVHSYRRSYTRGGYTTIPEHMPDSHRKHLEWTPSRLISWGGTVGPKTKELVEAILADRPHPEQGYRSCLGILRLARRYGNERLEAACHRAVAVRARSYRHVASILKNGLDRQLWLEPTSQRTGREHDDADLRGADYYCDQVKASGPAGG